MNILYLRERIKKEIERNEKALTNDKRNKTKAINNGDSINAGFYERQMEMDKQFIEKAQEELAQVEAVIKIAKIHGLEI